MRLRTSGSIIAPAIYGVLAGAPYYELVKEREGAPSFLPRCSRLFFSIFPSFSLAVLTSSLHKSARELYRLYLEGDNSQEFEPRIKRIFDNGHAVHDRLQTYLGNAGVLLQAEVPVESKEYEITGHTDGILQVGGTKGILEIKSMNANTFYSTYEPKEEHLIQVNIYMFCTGIERACLLYECKDDQALKEFYVKQDRSILDPILAKIEHVQKCLKNGREPKK